VYSIELLVDLYTHQAESEIELGNYKKAEIMLNIVIEKFSDDVREKGPVISIQLAFDYEAAMVYFHKQKSTKPFRKKNPFFFKPPKKIV
jgi:hypothetical protein